MDLANGNDIFYIKPAYSEQALGGIEGLPGALLDDGHTWRHFVHGGVVGGLLQISVTQITIFELVFIANFMVI